MPVSRTGYTLIELLVVISILSVMAVVGFINFNFFASTQIISKAAGQIQTLLRLAQSNATSSTLCNNQGATSWSLRFVNTSTIELRCNGASDTLQKTYNLENARVQIQCSGIEYAVLRLPAAFTYSSGAGTLTTACPSSSQTIIFTITNSLNPNTAPKTFKLSRGGAIDVQ